MALYSRSQRRQHEKDDFSTLPDDGHFVFPLEDINHAVPPYWTSIRCDKRDVASPGPTDVKLRPEMIRRVMAAWMTSRVPERGVSPSAWRPGSHFFALSARSLSRPG